MKDRCRGSRAVVEVSLCGNCANTNDIFRQRNVPEPALLGEVSNGGGALIESWVAQRSLVVGPHGDFVQVRIAHFPPLARYSKGIASTGVDGYRRVEFQRLAVLRSEERRVGKERVRVGQ